MSLKYNIDRKTITHKFEEHTCWRKSGLNDIDTYKLNLDYILSTSNVPFDCIKCDNGSPRQGTNADIMRRTGAKYHYAAHVS